MSIEVILKEVCVENLRGYNYACLKTDRSQTLIVGPNNSGKTSILRLLNWAFNEIDESLMEGKRDLTQEEETFLLPARDARHRARRLYLHVHIPDGRVGRKYKCDDGIACLRINLRLTPKKCIYVTEGYPFRGEVPESTPNGIKLLKLLQKSYQFIYVPSFRDARSTSFTTTLKNSLQKRIENRALNTAQAGAPTEHRDVSSAFVKIKETIINLSNPFWEDINSQLPSGMASKGELTLNCNQKDLLDFLETKLELKIATGEHDGRMVQLNELGSGLQSLLDLAVQRVKEAEDSQTIIAVEEPEAFLHPSAQRTVITKLLERANNNCNVVITTHSSIILEEAEFRDVVVSRQQRFYEPGDLSNEQRNAINTSLLNGYGSEMLFASAVLFVEGEGDSLFFEQIRRRVAKHDSSGIINTCFVVPAGGCTRFSPWMRLLNSYGKKGDRPIKWLVVCDGDASKEIQRGFKDAGIQLTNEVSDALDSISDAKDNKKVDDWRCAVQDANKKIENAKIDMFLLELDLEEAMLGKAEDTYINDITNVAKLSPKLNKDTLLKKLGAKGYGATSNERTFKEPWLRGYVGKTISPKQLTPNMKECITRWFRLVCDEEQIKKLFDKWGA